MSKSRFALAEAMDRTQAQDHRPRRGKLSGNAPHTRIPHARTEGRSQGRSRSAWTFSGRELERVQQDRAGSSQGSSGRARKAVGAVEDCWISLADHVIGVQTEYTLELGFLSY